jgi:hypothetical protein
MTFVVGSPETPRGIISIPVDPRYSKIPGTKGCVLLWTINALLPK